MTDPVEYYNYLKNKPINNGGYNNYSTSASSTNYNDSNFYNQGGQANQDSLPWWLNTEYYQKLIYRIEKVMPPVVQKALEDMNFIEFDAELHNEDEWNIYWKNSRPSLGEFKRAKTY
jgi:hypothetical protein